MKWFKFYGQDWLSDPKTLALSASERSCWITLLAYASINDDGIVKFLDEQQLMTQAGVSNTHEEWDYTIGVLEKFKNLKMITIDNEIITILNWGKRQETSLTGYQRVKRYREKHKNDNDDNGKDNAKITLDKNRIDKNRIYNTSDLISFQKFWDLYDKKKDKVWCENKWNKIPLAEQKRIMEYIPEYKKETPDIKYRKNPKTFLNAKNWEDEPLKEKVIW